MRTPDGHVIGEHPGVFYFTLGQREGLNIGGVRGFEPAPWYVVGKDVARNVLYVDQGSDSPWLQSQALRSEAAHWIAGSPPRAALHLHRPDPLPPARRGLRGDRRATTARWKCASPGPNARSRPGNRWCCTTVRSAWAAR